MDFWGEWRCSRGHIVLLACGWENEVASQSSVHSIDQCILASTSLVSVCAMPVSNSVIVFRCNADA